MEMRAQTDALPQCARFEQADHSTVAIEPVDVFDFAVSFLCARYWIRR